MTATEKLTGHEAIEAFIEAHESGQAIRVWSYSPNGGVGGPTASNDWGSEDWVNSLLSLEWASDIEGGSPDLEVDWDGERLALSDTPERGVHQYYELRYKASPDGGRERVAYLGAHAGFLWEDESVKSEPLKTLLRYCSWDDEALAEFGLASCEDYDCGDDGGYWLVAVAEKFAAVAEKCRELSERWDDLEAEDVLAFLRDGTEPAEGG